MMSRFLSFCSRRVFLTGVSLLHNACDFGQVDVNDLVLGNPLEEGFTLFLWLVALAPVLDAVGSLEDGNRGNVHSLLSLVNVGTGLETNALPHLS